MTCNIRYDLQCLTFNVIHVIAICYASGEPVQCLMLDMLLLIVMLQESLFNVGPANPDFSLKTRGGDLNLGFEVVSPSHDDLDHRHGHHDDQVYPLDGGPGPAGRLGPDPSLPPAQ